MYARWSGAVDFGRRLKVVTISQTFRRITVTVPQAPGKGDLLFFVPERFPSNDIPGHVGIYIGEGKMIHCLPCLICSLELYLLGLTLYLQNKKSRCRVRRRA
ncbi:NlpC/P60 family protein [Paenibacillus gansuensis]|uniref:NlpC/P60 family protein n=1 Tax=Paenibacillus gansuensis TaxID=306542 RepID=A0ABW5PGJ6_9BACL